MHFGSTTDLRIELPKLRDAVVEGESFSFDELLRSASRRAAFEVWMGRVIDLLNDARLGKSPQSLAVKGREEWPDFVPGHEDMLEVAFEKSCALVIEAARAGIRVIEEMYEDQPIEPPKTTAAASTERPRSMTSEYDLTEDQKAILRLLVEHVRTDGRRGDDVWITFGSHFTKISDFEGDSPPFSRNYLKIFANNGLMEYHPYPGSRDQYICTLTRKAKDAVDTDFRALTKTESQTETRYPVVIQDSLARFKADHPDPSKVAFIMMQFGTTSAHEKIVEGIRTTLAPHGITALRADDKQYHDDLFPNVRTYIYGCGFAVAVFERIKADDFNPNVSLEVGYMLALGKPVCYLKDQDLKTLQTDLVGKLYKTFDHLDPVGTIPDELRNWLYDKGIVTKGG